MYFKIHSHIILLKVVHLEKYETKSNVDLCISLLESVFLYCICIYRSLWMNSMSITLPPWKTTWSVLLSYVPDFIMFKVYTHTNMTYYFKMILIDCTFMPLVFEEDYFSFTSSRNFCITSMLFFILIYMFQLPAFFCCFTYGFSISRMLS